MTVSARILSEMAAANRDAAVAAAVSWLEAMHDEWAEVLADGAIEMDAEYHVLNALITGVGGGGRFK